MACKTLQEIVPLIRRIHTPIQVSPVEEADAGGSPAIVSRRGKNEQRQRGSTGQGGELFPARSGRAPEWNWSGFKTKKSLSCCDAVNCASWSTTITAAGQHLTRHAVSCWRHAIDYRLSN